MKSVIAGFGGIGGGGGKGKDAGIMVPSPASRPALGIGGGGGGGTDKPASSDSDIDDDAALLDEASGKGILGPIDDLNIGGFPGGGAPEGFKVG